MRRSVALLATLAFAGVAAPAHADDSKPTQWQLDAHAEALQHAPEPKVKPVICIVDFGVTPTPDLDIVHRQALDGGTLDDVTATPGNFGHGTTVAHMAAGKVNGWGASGVFPHARIASVRIFSRPGELVPWQGYINALQQCLSVEPRPVVALLSVGGAQASEAEAADLSNQIQITRRYMSVVAAAGNGGAQADMPARLPAVLSVAGARADGALCAFSARGPAVDLLAPGCEITQSGWQGSSWSLAGTSFSAPIVAGTLAALRAYKPDLDVDAAEELLATSARAGVLPRIDIGAALRSAGIELPTPVATRQAESPTATSPAASTMPRPSPSASQHGSQVPPQTGLARQWLPPSRTRTRHKRLSPPRARVRVTRHRTLLSIRNRPRGVSVEVRTPHYATRQRASRFSVSGRVRVIRVRFVDELKVSRWVRLFTSNVPD